MVKTPATVVPLANRATIKSRVPGPFFRPMRCPASSIPETGGIAGNRDGASGDLFNMLSAPKEWGGQLQSSLVGVEGRAVDAEPFNLCGRTKIGE